MIIGLDRIKDHPDCGIPEAHLRAFIQTSKRHHVVVGVRAVSPMAKLWIEQGYPSKSFVIKNKTSRSGPCQGLIAMDPGMGRMSAASSHLTMASSLQSGSYENELVPVPVQSLAETYKKQLAYALEHDDRLQPIPLILTRDDLDALIDIDIQAEPPADYTLFWYDEEGYLKVAKAQFDGQNYALMNENGQAMMVLGKQVTNAQGQQVVLPITADYDLLVVCPTYQDFSPGRGQRDHTPLRTQSFTASGEDFKKIIDKEVQRPDSPQEDPKGGNWSERIRDVVSTINAEISTLDDKHRGQFAEGLEMAHHNAEFSNPFASPLKGSLPALIVLPEPMDLDQSGVLSDCVMVETKEELNQIRNHLHDQGYYWPANVNLKEDVPVFPEEKITTLDKHIKRQIEHKEALQSLQNKRSPTSVNQNEGDTDTDSDSESKKPH